MSTAPLSRTDIINEIVAQHALLPRHVYLLDLVPLIEMMWADGKIQAAEISLLYEHVVKHLAELSSEGGGLDVLSAAEVNAFLDRFLSERPDPRLLKRLRELALSLHRTHSNPEKIVQRHTTLLGLCMDIAAAAVVDYPYEKHERIMAAEKRLLTEIMAALNIAPDQRVSFAR